MIFMYIFIGICVAAIAGALSVEAYHKRHFGISYGEYNELSWPAQQVMGVWNKVPASNRPSVDIMTVLRALDKKHGGAYAVTKRYSRSDYNGNTSYGWGFAKSGNTYYSDYFVLSRGFEDINEALAEQEYTFAMAGIANHLETAKNIREVVEAEANMIREITAKVKEDMS